MSIEQAPALESAAISIEGMSCASCVVQVEKAARAVPGVQACEVNLARGRAKVRFDAGQTTPKAVAEAITRTGYHSEVERTDLSASKAEGDRTRRQLAEAQAWKIRAIIGIVLWLPVELAHWAMQIAGGSAHSHWAAQSTAMGWISLAASTVAITWVGGRFYASALSALRHRTSNMDTLISMGVTVAYGYSVTYFVGGLLHVWPAPMMHELFFMEATGLLALISLGHWLEARARQSAGSAIRQLLELAPEVALKLTTGGASAPVQLRFPTKKTSAIAEGARPDLIPGRPPLSPAPIEEEESRPNFVEAPISTLVVGDRVLVQPGQRVPIDGVVIEGESSVDESMITGESIPVHRKVGDKVIGGTVNQEGRLIVRVAKIGADTALAQIVSLVENAQSKKPPVQKLADRISAVFVPCVLGIAILTGLAWWLIGMHRGMPVGEIAAQVAKNVCSVLIIACPCALGLAVPATVMVGVGRGAKRGILIRDIDALQKAEKITAIVFDKTGTLTEGKPVVSDIITFDGTNSDEVLRVAASAEQFSAHPLAKAIVAKARERGLKLSNADSFKSEAGAGVVATIAGRTFLVGSDAFLKSSGAAVEAPAAQSSLPSSPGTAGEGKTQAIAPLDASATRVELGEKMADGSVHRIGALLIRDPIKPDSADAIRRLQEQGFLTVLLSGDHRAAAEMIGREAGIADVRAQVKPAEKAAAIRELQKTHRVAMVGDGINDAPALAAADLGIAIGGGSDIAKEAGDIVLVSGSLNGVASALHLSRATMRKIRQNLFLAFIYNIVAIPLAASGLLSPLIAAAAMALSDVTVVLNALLLRGEE